MGQHRAHEDKPLQNTATVVGAVVAVVGAIVSYLVQSGILTETQSGAIGTLVTAIVGVLGAFGVHVGAKDKLTSVSEPKDADGNPLVPMVVGDADDRSGNDERGSAEDEEPKKSSNIDVADVMELPQNR